MNTFAFYEVQRDTLHIVRGNEDWLNFFTL
jgi:hypothetical protein